MKISRLLRYILCDFDIHKWEHFEGQGRWEGQYRFCNYCGMLQHQKHNGKYAGRILTCPKATIELLRGD